MAANTTRNLESQADWEAIKALLPPDLGELARANGLAFNPPSGFEGKLADAYDLVRLLFVYAGLQFSLSTTTIVAKAGDIVDFTPQALQKWVRRSGPFMAAILRELFRLPDQPAPFFVKGFRLSVVDATTVQRPGARGTTARLHFHLGVPTLELLEVQVTGDEGGETLRRFTFGPGDLVLGDRVFGNPPGVLWVVRQGADVLVRYNTGTLPLFDRHNQPFELWPKLRALREGAGADWSVKFQEGKAKPQAPQRWQHARLLAVRVAPEAAARERAHVKADKGARTTAQDLELAGYLVLLTTVARRELAQRELLEIFRLRWQVELLMKREKSIEGVDCLPTRTPATIRTWLLTKMVLTWLKLRLAGLDPGKEFWQAMADQPWRLTVMLEAVLDAALLPIRLSQLAQVMRGIAESLARIKRPNQRRAFRERFS